MTSLREAAQQALEALEHAPGYSMRRTDAITALSAALAEPVQEPVAWMVYTLDGKSVCVTDNPVDFTDEHRALPLYTAPPQRKPLTEEEILKAMGWDIAEMYMKLTPNFPVAEAKKETLKNARAIERVHGIS